MPRLVCPDDRAPLQAAEESLPACPCRSARGQALRCPRCGERFPIRDGIACFAAQAASVQTDELQTQREMEARDEQASIYDRLRGLRLLSAWELPAAMRALAVRDGDAVLDAGCGTGRLMCAAARLQSGGPGVELAGADISLESLKLCRNKLSETGREATLVQAPLWKLPFEDCAFDAVACLGVMQHISCADLRARAYQELGRVMKPGARLFLTAYHFWQPAGLFTKREGYHRGGIYFLRFRPGELRRELEAHFEVRKIQRIWGYMLGATCFRR